MTEFWVNARKYISKENALTGQEIKEIADASRQYHLFWDRDIWPNHEKNVAIGDGERVEIVGKHFFTVPPATTHRAL